ncbi:MAG TPA: DUF533 domain-containing protein [Kofleriaceae bacterium]|jgi:uncharacterized protein (DUF697 family)/tellurite resistance protein|nr:DUF533 domain-containing protein [Kofleriaceae bacterium]
MRDNTNECRACLRALVAVAKADGTITAEERESLAAALDTLPDAGELQPFLDEKIDFDKVLAEVTSAEARDQLWLSAYSMIHADGTATPSEQALLDKLRATFGIDDAKVTSTKRLLDEAKDTLLPSNIEPIADAARRGKEIDQDVLKYSVMSAVLGAFPVPGIAIATDLAIVALQVKLVRDIGQYWGHKVDKEAAKTLLAGLGLGTGARIAVSNLAKLVPVWGSAFGATSAFATTWALGRIANRYFEAGAKDDVGQLKKDLKAMQKVGKEAYAQQKATIDAKQEATSIKLARLNDQRKAGEITQPEYEKQVAALAD